MADTPVPPPPPSGPGHGPPPAPPWAQPPPPRSGGGRIVLMVVVGVVVVVAGCGALLYVGGSRLVGAARAPVDTANEFLDALRAGDDPGAHLCDGRDRLEATGDLAASEGQNLSSVHISNNRVATVSGTVTLAGQQRSPLTVELRRDGDGWCVDSTRFEAAPD